MPPAPARSKSLSQPTMKVSGQSFSPGAGVSRRWAEQALKIYPQARPSPLLPSPPLLSPPLPSPLLPSPPLSPPFSSLTSSSLFLSSPHLSSTEDDDLGLCSPTFWKRLDSSGPLPYVCAKRGDSELLMSGHAPVVELKWPRS